MQTVAQKPQMHCIRDSFNSFCFAGVSAAGSQLYITFTAVENEKFASPSVNAEAGGVAEYEESAFMAATGELIRLINYVDDINTTLRRIQASLYGMDADERKRLADSLRNADKRLRELLEQVEKQ